jgi:hypothetical protein
MTKEQEKLTGLITFDRSAGKTTSAQRRTKKNFLKGYFCGSLVLKPVGTALEIFK